MSFDESLANRIRSLVAHEPAVTEKRMFGGLAFLLNGHMAVVANSAGDMMVRTSPSDVKASYLAAAEPTMMRGRQMSGWLDLPASVLADDETLSSVVSHGLAFARTLPPK